MWRSKGREQRVMVGVRYFIYINEGRPCWKGNVGAETLRKRGASLSGRKKHRKCKCFGEACVWCN